MTNALIEKILIKKVRELEGRIERLENGKKPYDDPYKKSNPYDLSEVAGIIKNHKEEKNEILSRNN